jgi:hypothetical protein
LPVCLLAMPIKDWKNRTARLWPMLAVPPLYALWRWWMLGGVIGGYSEEVGLKQVLLMPTELLAVVGWDWIFTKGLVLLLLLILLVKIEIHSKIFVLILLGAVLLPLVPVSGMIVPRYGILPALLVAVLFGWTLESVSFLKAAQLKQLVVAGLVFVSVGQLWWNNLVVWRQDLRERLAQVKAEGHYLLAMGEKGELIRNPGGALWFYEGLRWLRREVLELPAGPVVFSDPICLGEVTQYRVLEYDRDKNRVAEVRGFSKQVTDFSKKIRSRAPLSIRLNYEDKIVTWEFGPWSDGKYALVHEDRMLYTVPRKGKRRLKLSEEVGLRVRYTSPEGWITYSPRLSLQINSGKGSLVCSR